jgi:pyruvate kinase
LNFSHKTEEEATRVIGMIHQIREELDRPIAIMADIKGPSVRMYGYKEPIQLSQGDILSIESWSGLENVDQSESREALHVWTNLPSLGKIIAVGQRVVLQDGYFTGEVVELGRDLIKVKVQNAGALRPKAHLTLPNVDYPIPFLSDKDVSDITFAIKKGVEYVALSFVRCATDVEEARRLIGRIKLPNGKPDARIIAKIETSKGLENIDEIVATADGIMVARGDMGVEMPIEAVPLAQKRIIRTCYLAGKPVITATQMLESMIENPIPTRAEATDVANACYDSTSAVMLSGETAIGRFPVKVVQTMSNIIRTVEADIDYEGFHRMLPPGIRTTDLTSVVSYNALSVAYECEAAAIVCLTETGYAARQLSRLRPRLPIYAMVTDERVYHQLALNWDVVPFKVKACDDLDCMIASALETCMKKEALRKGDKVVVVAGMPLGKQGSTNMIRVESA